MVAAQNSTAVKHFIVVGRRHAPYFHSQHKECLSLQQAVGSWCYPGCCLVLDSKPTFRTGNDVSSILFHQFPFGGYARAHYSSIMYPGTHEFYPVNLGSTLISRVLPLHAGHPYPSFWTWPSRESECTAERWPAGIIYWWHQSSERALISVYTMVETGKGTGTRIWTADTRWLSQLCHYYLHLSMSVIVTTNDSCI